MPAVVREDDSTSGVDSFLGYAWVRRNAATITVANERAHGLHFPTRYLRENLHAVLRSTQGTHPEEVDATVGPWELLTDPDGPGFARLMARFSQGTSDPRPDISTADAVAMVADARRELEGVEGWWGGRTLDIVDLLVGALMVSTRLPRATGSTAEALGVVLIRPELPRLSGPDTAMAILHEAVHEALFIDHWVHSLVHVPEGSEEDYDLVWSPVRREPRPLWLALHATAVVLTLDAFAREREPRYPDRDRELAECARSLAELRAKDELLQPQGARILSELEAVHAAL